MESKTASAAPAATAGSEKNNRPSDSAFKQQKLKAWQPILTPTWVVCTFMVIAIVFLPVGGILFAASDNVVEYTIKYDDVKHNSWCEASGNSACTGDSNKQYQKVQVGQTKFVTFTVDKDMEAPIYLYYQLENFYQNHRRYVKSRDDEQLRGKDTYVKGKGSMTAAFNAGTNMNSVKNNDFASCSPLAMPNNIESSDCKWSEITHYHNQNISCKIMWPCGLIAGSFFNDVFNPIVDDSTLESVSNVSGLAWSESDIAWESDRNYKFKKPTTDSAGWNWADEVAKGNTSGYYLLNQQYPNFPRLAEEGPENEHFIVWMRTAGLPTFRKLYARIGTSGQKISAGTQVKIKIASYFDVEEFEGTKSLVLSTTSWMGGKNPFLGIAYLVVGSIALALAAVFFAMDYFKPRKLGDTNYLVWKTKN